ncbi:MAG TPA: hypothetical protein VLZ31_03775 [Microbacteriaceae bacterium]|nr:hypothetical protein [Microbacteriaceae bacterium]
METFTASLWAITPTLLVGIFFAWVLRSILRADRTERKIFKNIEEEERQKAGLPPKA